MKNKTLMITSIVVITAIAATIAYMVLSSQNLSPAGTATYNNNGVVINVSYFRPSKRGRLIFGDAAAGALVPNGKYWRLGANDATEMTLSKDVTFGGMPMKAGTYRIYAIPNESSWMIVLNSELGRWGADEPNPDLDVLKLEVPVERVSSETELFTISFDSNAAEVKMNFDWDKTRISIPIGVQ